MAEKQKLKINLGTFDLVKGIAMLAIIFAHMQYRYSIQKLLLISPLWLIFGLIGPSLMPMFFVISGFGFKEKSPGKILKKTVSELIVPFLYAVAAYLAICTVMQWTAFDTRQELFAHIGSQLFGFLLGLPARRTVLGYELMSTGAIWFFLALFTAENILNLIVKVKNAALQAALAVLCVAAGFVLLQLDVVYFCIPQGLTAVGFCYIGYLLKNRKWLEQGIRSKWAYLVLVPVCLVQFAGAVLTGEAFSMVSGNFSIVQYLMAANNGVLFTFMGVLCGRFKNKWINWIRWVGMHSYWIIMIHTIEILALPWDIMAQRLHNQPLMFAVEVGLKVLIITTGCEMIKKVSQIRYKRKLEKNGKVRNHERSGRPVCQ